MHRSFDYAPICMDCAVGLRRSAQDDNIAQDDNKWIAEIVRDWESKTPTTETQRHGEKSGDLVIG